MDDAEVEVEEVPAPERVEARRRPARKPNSSPATRRGRESRQRLLEAARQVFEDVGYLEARVHDITKAAGMGQGSFYDYFKSKEEVFSLIATQVTDELREAARGSTSSSDDPATAIAEANRHYIEAYVKHARMLAIIEQVSTFNAEFRELRLGIRRSNIDRIEAGIRAWQREGTCDQEIDARCAASALASMVGNFAYMWLGLGEEHEFDAAVDTLNRLWINSLGLSGGTGSIPG